MPGGTSRQTVIVRVKVVQRRGGAFEAEHPVEAVLCDATGRVLARAGDGVATTFRSAAKPFQLATCLEVLGEAAAGLTDEQLALGAASHHGEPGHVRGVTELVHRLGRQESELLCGSHPPVHAPSARAMYAAGGEPAAVHHNCSGKHAFMAAAAAHLGGDMDYRGVAHPLQQRVLTRIQAVSGARQVPAVIDGCGLPCWVLTLDGMARAWASVAEAAMREPDSPLGRTAWAMQRKPWFVSGTDAFDGWLMMQATRPIVAKVGADGLLCVALFERRQGFALKVRSGSGEARAAAVYSCLKRWAPELIEERLPERYFVLRNAAGLAVGELTDQWSQPGA